MASNRKIGRIQEIITRAGLVDDMQVGSANAHLDKWGGTFSHVIVSLGFADEERVVEAIGAALGMKVEHLGNISKDANALARLEVGYCEENLIFPFAFRNRVVSLAMADPTQLRVIDEVQARYGARVQPFLASGTEILAAISKHYRNIEVSSTPNRSRRAVIGAMPSAPRSGQVTSRMAALKGSSADLMLNDILGENLDDGDFAEPDLARLRLAQQTQEKAGLILAAVRALLDEKGTFR
jgi:hypothetical protein